MTVVNSCQPASICKGGVIFQYNRSGTKIIRELLITVCAESKAADGILSHEHGADTGVKIAHPVDYLTRKLTRFATIIRSRCVMPNLLHIEIF